MTTVSFNVRTSSFQLFHELGQSPGVLARATHRREKEAGAADFCKAKTHGTESGAAAAICEWRSEASSYSNATLATIVAASSTGSASAASAALRKFLPSRRFRRVFRHAVVGRFMFAHAASEDSIAGGAMAPGMRLACDQPQREHDTRQIVRPLGPQMQGAQTLRRLRGE